MSESEFERCQRLGRERRARDAAFDARIEAHRRAGTLIETSLGEYPREPRLMGLARW